MRVYARVSASLRLYECDRDDFHASTVVSEARFRADDIALNSGDVRSRARTFWAFLFDQNTRGPRVCVQCAPSVIE